MEGGEVSRVAIQTSPVTMTSFYCEMPRGLAVYKSLLVEETGGSPFLKSSLALALATRWFPFVKSSLALAPTIEIG